jgi:hypothetical protein
MFGTLLQIPGPGPSCFSGGFNIGCLVAPYSAALGTLFVVVAAFALGGGLAIYQRSAAPLAVVAVLVGALSIDVLPAIAGRATIMLAIATAAGALFLVYRRLA